MNDEKSRGRRTRFSSIVAVRFLARNTNRDRSSRTAANRTCASLTERSGANGRAERGVCIACRADTCAYSSCDGIRSAGASCPAGPVSSNVAATAALSVGRGGGNYRLWHERLFDYWRMDRTFSGSPFQQPFSVFTYTGILVFAPRRFASEHALDCAGDCYTSGHRYHPSSHGCIFRYQPADASRTQAILRHRLLGRFLDQHNHRRALAAQRSPRDQHAGPDNRNRAAPVDRGLILADFSFLIPFGALSECE